MCLSLGMFLSSIKKHMLVNRMSRIPWKSQPTSLPKPLFKRGCRSGSFISAMYSIILPVAGYTNALAKWISFQWLVPNAIAWLAVSMFDKSSCTKFLGERFCVLADTLSFVWPPSEVMVCCVLGSHCLAFVTLFDNCAALEKLKMYVPVLLVVCFQRPWEMLE
jgi:hypothetical protein